MIVARWRWLPRTLPGLVACGFLLTALPILSALLVAGVMMDRLAQSSDTLVRDSLQAVHQGVALRDGLTALERNSRQYLVVQDPALRELVDQRYAEASEQLVHLRASRKDAALTRAIDTLQEQIGRARHQWAEPETAAGAVRELTGIESLAVAVITANQDDIRQRSETLRRYSDKANRIMVLLTLVLVPLTALLIFGFWRAIARPLRQLRESITELGHGRHDQPIRIAFPAEMRRLATQVDWLRRRLGRLEADKDRFLRHVSHELKTPLSSLLEGAQLLSERSLGPLNKPQAEITGILCESAAELEASITNLLAYAEWRSGRQQANAEWFEAETMLEEILGAHRLALRRRNLQTAITIESPHLHGQRSRLRSALDNLITNAIKHAPADSTIEIGVRAQAQQFELSVRDHGLGVPEHEKETIFEPFVRGNAAVESSVRGTGVGLSIVRDAAHAHGGEARVLDAHPGADFRLVWPCKSGHV